MQKKDTKQQVAEVIDYVKDKAPEAVSYTTIMLEFNYGITKAQTLCKLIGDNFGQFEYKLGKIRCKEEVLDKEFKQYYDEKFGPSPAGDEKPVQIGAGEAAKIFKILRARPTSPKDKGELKMPKKSKEKWRPASDFY